jgi:hypothetical protein
MHQDSFVHCFKAGNKSTTPDSFVHVFYLLKYPDPHFLSDAYLDPNLFVSIIVFSQPIGGLVCLG